MRDDQGWPTAAVVLQGHAGRYLAVVFAGLALLLALAAGLVFLASALGQPRSPEEDLLAFQLDKLAAADAEVAFLGDSSLGNAIDVGVWQDLTGDRAVSLALTGGFGLSGTVNMAGRLIAAPAPPRRLIVMQTVDIFTRPVSRIGALWTSGPDDLDPFAQIELYMRRRLNDRAVYAAALWLLAYATGDPDATAAPQQQLANDYISQLTPLGALPAAPPLSAYMIDPAAEDLLAELATMCAAATVRCTYVHGPLVAPLCEGEPEYLAVINAMVRAAGLELASERPLCIARDDLGDALDHVAPAAKAEYTARFADLLASAGSP